MAMMILAVPTQSSDAQLPCGSAGIIVLSSVQLTPLTRRNGYAFSGKVTIRGIDYTIKMITNMAGDQMSGTFDVTRRDNGKVTQNVLQATTCAFPNLPHRATWHKIRFSGINDYVTLIIDSQFSAALPAGARSASVRATLGMSVIDVTTNSQVSSVSRVITMNGSDKTGWVLPGNISQFTLTLTNKYDVETYGQVIAMYYDFDNITITLGDRAVKLVGNMTYSNTTDGNTSPSNMISFASPFITTTYNQTFPWVATFNIFDSTNTDMSLIASTAVIPDLPSQYKVVITAYLTGSGS